MNADASAPATSSSNSAFGTLNAAQNASSCGLAPKVAPITESRSQPRTRLAMSAAIITTDARAPDIVTRRSMRRVTRLSFHRYGNEKEQAFVTQADPSDPPAQPDQDAGPPGRPHRGQSRWPRARE